MTTSEMDELRRRLQEAEDTIRAIRTGAADALVVRRAQDEEIFTLQGGDDAYRTFMEAMNEGAVAVDAEGTVLYANGAFLGLLNVSLEELQGRRLGAYLDDPAWREAEGELSARQRTRATVEVRLPETLGRKTVLLSLAPLAIGMIDGWAIVASDLSERLGSEQAAESERAARAVIESANEAVVVCDPEGVITHASAAVAGLYDGVPVGRRIDEVFDFDFDPAADDPPRTVMEVVDAALRGTPTRGIEAGVAGAPAVSDVLVSAAPVRVIGGRVSGCVITMTDLTRRKAAEAHQALLMAEMDHRVKNTLSVVLGICALTSSGHTTLESFRQAFESRIRALAETHNLLAARRWSGASLKEVVGAELAAYMDPVVERVRVEGADVTVTPRVALNIGLLFHELATNAVKYGALSVPEGRIECRWASCRSDRGEVLRIAWIETGGPPVSPPARKGFGCTLIERGVAMDIGGTARIEFAAAGVRCEIDIPIAETSLSAS